MTLSQTAQDLDHLPVSVHKVHRLDSTHHHHVDSSEARGIASTKMAETVDTEQNQKHECVGKMICHCRALWSRHDT